MKRIRTLFLKLLPHAVLILSLMLLVFFVIDRFNDSMGFLNNAGTKWLLFANGVLASFLSVIFIVKEEEKQNEENIKSNQGDEKDV